MIFGGFLDTDLTNQCYIIDHNRQSIQKMKKNRVNGAEAENAQAAGGQMQSEANQIDHAARIAERGQNGAPAGGQGPINRAEQRVGENNQQINPIVEVNAEPEVAPVDEAANANNNEQMYVTMKKSKKFIKFKDYIIKLPNSMGLIGSRNQGQVNMNNDLGPFVEQA